MDAITEWAAAQHRVLDLVQGLTPEQARHKVPACPDWSAHDLFAHMIGLGADVVTGDEPADHNEDWARRQVAGRADRDLATLAGEWRDLTEPLLSWMRRHGTGPLNDVIIHEQDLRGALGTHGTYPGWSWCASGCSRGSPDAWRAERRSR